MLLFCLDLALESEPGKMFFQYDHNGIDFALGEDITALKSKSTNWFKFENININGKIFHVVVR